MTIRYFYLLLIILIFTGSSLNDARKANEAYRQGDYAAAVELYKKAIDNDPENPRLHFNLGNAFAKLGNNEEAAKAFERFKDLTDDLAEKSKADYNIGNLFSNEEQFDEALAQYREALKKNPDDPDAKFNYELALQKKQEQEDQQQQQQDQNQDQDQDQDQDQQDQDQQQNQDQDQDQQNQDNQPSDPQDQENNQPQPQQMSLEEAKRVLDALEQRERELLKDMKKESSENKSSNDKDW
ncbi:MAG: tetratricopeptide repeat protein [Balneolaceae bacterium]